MFVHIIYLFKSLNLAFGIRRCFQENPKEREHTVFILIWTHAQFVLTLYMDFTNVFAFKQ